MKEKALFARFDRSLMVSAIERKPVRRCFWPPPINSTAAAAETLEKIASRT